MTRRVAVSHGAEGWPRETFLLRLAALCLLFPNTACVSNLTDLPVVRDGFDSGQRIYVLASGERDYPYAVRGHWAAAGQLAADLERAGFVPSIVLRASAAPAGAPMIELIVHGGGCFSHAYLTVLTLGVIPEFGCREYGHRFMLRCSTDNEPLEVNARFSVRSYVGWFVWPLALSANWAYDHAGPPMQRREEVLYLREQLQDALRLPSCARG